MVSTRSPVRELFWRVVAINGLVFTAGTLVLAFAPVTVSQLVNLAEVPVLVVGLALILALNAVLVRTSLNRLEAAHIAGGALALAAQEDERQRIARELHDEIGQSLTVALLSLRRVAERAPEELRAEAEVAQQAVRSSLDEVRQVARRLRPGVLAELGLRSALTELTDEFSRTSGVPVRRSVPKELPQLDGETELVVYRVAQEALTNVARHAGASAAELEVLVSDERLVLRVADDGRGGVDREGVGIRGMRERAALIGAELVVGAVASGTGTVVRLIVPGAGYDGPAGGHRRRGREGTRPPARPGAAPRPAAEPGARP